MTTTAQEKAFSTVPLDWSEVFYTNCPMVSANNVDQELGWCKTDFKKIGVDYSYFRSRRENDFDVHEWAAPEFLEQAAEEPVEERWQKVTTEKLSQVSELHASTRRLG